jgi:hypothetical protein
MGPNLTCLACGAPGAIALPSDERPGVTCTACQRVQPRRPYEALRLKGAAGPGSVLCPACGQGILAPETGCPRCGHGRTGISRAWTLGAATAGVVGLLGVIGMLTVGSALRKSPGPLMNGLVILMSMVFSGYGVRAVVEPTTLRIAASQGHDSWGKSEYGPSQPASRREGVTMGLTFLGIGAVLLLLGFFLGRLAR